MGGESPLRARERQAREGACRDLCAAWAGAFQLTAPHPAPSVSVSACPQKYERFLADLREAGWTPEHVVVAPGPWRVAAGPGAAAEGAGVARPLWATLGPRVGAAAANGGGSVGADPAWAAAGEELVTGDAAAVEDGEEELLYGSAGAAGVVAAA